MDAIRTWDGSPLVDYHTAIDREVTFFLRQNKMTQAQLAEKLGMNQATLAMKRKGVTEFKIGELMKFTQMCGRSLDQICGLE